MELRTVQDVGAQALTRESKLMRWAALVDTCGYKLRLLHMLEHMEPEELKRVKCTSTGPTALALAANDPVFNAAGLGRSDSIQGAMDFFEITQKDLHTFSCDCGGDITPRGQANRIQSLAR